MTQAPTHGTPNKRYGRLSHSDTQEVQRKSPTVAVIDASLTGVQLGIDLVGVEGARIDGTADPFLHLGVLGMLRPDQYFEELLIVSDPPTSSGGHVLAHSEDVDTALESVGMHTLPDTLRATRN